MSTEDENITLETFDKHLIKVSKNTAKMSSVINMMIEDIEDENAIVPLSDKSCTQSTMNLVIKYLEKHIEFKKEKTENNIVIEFDNEFQDQSDKIIFSLILAANFLDIKDLLELMCKKIADELKKCNTQEDVRERFDIREEITQSDVDAVRNAHPWVLDNT